MARQLLPNLIGIGVPKAGTTWLHQVLDSHPRVWMPERKELHFFDRDYDRGVEWYGSFFPDQSRAAEFPVIGEVTPHYLYAGATGAARIRDFGTVRQLVLMLRDPVDRAWSHYWFRVRVERYTGSFETFLGERPQVSDWGLYARHLRPWLDVFDPGQILVLVYEEAFTTPDATLARLGAYLGIDPAGFSREVAGSTVNRRFAPRWPRMYSAAVTAGRYLRRYDLDRVVARLRASPLRGLVEQGRKKQEERRPMDPDTRARLIDLYAPDVVELEQQIGRSLDVWRRRWERNA